jgi:hypothetical protein
MEGKEIRHGMEGKKPHKWTTAYLDSIRANGSEQFLVIINFIKLILLKIRVRNVKFQIYE